MKSAEDLIARSSALILDFDGPLATLMPVPQNSAAADRARQPLGDVDLPPEVRDSVDHLAVLRWTFNSHPSRLRAVEEACTAAEVECAQTCEKSPEADWLLSLAERFGLPVGIASNNSEASVRTFLMRFGWKIDVLSCRTAESVRLMKPRPAYVLAVADWLGVPASSAVFVGDSVSDVLAGRAAGSTVIGLAKSEHRSVQLLEAGVDAIISHRDRRHDS